MEAEAVGKTGQFKYSPASSSLIYVIIDLCSFRTGHTLF